MKPTERDIHLRMIDTLCNMLSAERMFIASKISYQTYQSVKDSGAIEAEVREIAERELKEQP